MASNARPAHKRRMILTDSSSGRAAVFVRVACWAEVASGTENPGHFVEKNVELDTGKSPDSDDGSQEEREHIHLGILQSDHAGYVSFDLSPIHTAHKHISSLFVDIIGSNTQPLDVTTKWKQAHSDAALSLSIPRANTWGEKSPNLPAIRNPDVSDWNASPRSFGAQAIQVIGQDGCETLLLSNAAVHRYGFVQIIRNIAQNAQQLQLAESSPCDEKQTSPPAICFREGIVIEYETTWRPMGHGLGEVLYSLPLAPCESVKLAMIDWTRADEMGRSEDLAISEQLFLALFPTVDGRGTIGAEKGKGTQSINQGQCTVSHNE